MPGSLLNLGPMLRQLVLVGSLLVVAACSPDTDGPIAARGSAVIRGSVETGYRSVVAVMSESRSGVGGLCTGTAIGRYAVMTAKHCVFNETSSGTFTAISPSDLYVFVGSNVNDRSGIEDYSVVTDVITTPGDEVDVDVNNGDDIAIVLLPRDLGLTPYATATSGPSTGDSVTVVGYGRTMTGTPRDDDSGVKYRGETEVSGVYYGLVETYGGSWTCQGDSGGPLFDSSNTVVGITSFGLGHDCYNSTSYFTRVSRHAEMIADAATYAPPCTATTERCDGTDNDCDGETDEGCTILGDACSSDDECADGQCASVHGRRVCVRDCDPRDAIPHCPIGFYCEETGCGEGRCIEGAEGHARDGQPCDSDLDCHSNRCTTVGGNKICAHACSVDTAGVCAASEVCEAADSDSCASCIDVTLSTHPRPIGSPCDTNEQCSSSLCDSGRCTTHCDSSNDCPGGTHCRADVCVQGDLGGPGSRCDVAEDCGTAAPDCVQVDDDKLCAGSCGDGDTCGGGLQCEDTALGRKCVPSGRPLGAECDRNSQCRTNICATVCTFVCDEPTDCPSGFDCVPAGEVSGCFAHKSGHVGADGGLDESHDSGGGCSVNTSKSAETHTRPLLFTLLFLLATYRRRR